MELYICAKVLRLTNTSSLLISIITSLIIFAYTIMLKILIFVQRICWYIGPRVYLHHELETQNKHWEREKEWVLCKCLLTFHSWVVFIGYVGGGNLSRDPISLQVRHRPFSHVFRYFYKRGISIQCSPNYYCEGSNKCLKSF